MAFVAHTKRKKFDVDNFIELSKAKIDAMDKEGSMREKKEKSLHEQDLKFAKEKREEEALKGSSELETTRLRRV